MCVEHGTLLCCKNDKMSLHLTFFFFPLRLYLRPLWSSLMFLLFITKWLLTKLLYALQWALTNFLIAAQPTGAEGSILMQFKSSTKWIFFIFFYWVLLLSDIHVTAGGGKNALVGVRKMLVFWKHRVTFAEVTFPLPPPAVIWEIKLIQGYVQDFILFFIFGGVGVGFVICNQNEPQDAKKPLHLQHLCLKTKDPISLFIHVLSPILPCFYSS